MSTATLDGTRPGRLRALLARFGIAGFLFFLIKGLAWLVVPVLLYASH